MAEVITVSGVLAGTDCRSYSFNEEGTNRLVEGTTRKAWLITGEGEPTLVTFRDDKAALFGSVEGAPQFSSVELRCELSASRNTLKRNVLEVVNITAPGK